MRHHIVSLGLVVWMVVWSTVIVPGHDCADWRCDTFPTTQQSRADDLERCDVGFESQEPKDCCCERSNHQEAPTQPSEDNDNCQICLIAIRLHTEAPTPFFALILTPTTEFVQLPNVHIFSVPKTRTVLGRAPPFKSMPIAV